MAWTAVQSRRSATSAVSASSNLTSGSLIIVFHADGSNTGTTETCSKTAGTAMVGSFTRFGGADNVANNECIVGFWATCSAGGSATFTVAGGVTSIDTEFAEFTGQAASPADVMGSGDTGQTGSTAANGDKSQSITTTADGDLVVGYISDLIGTATFTKGSSPNVFTELQTVAGAEMEYFIQGTAGAIQATWTASAADAFQSVIGSWKVAAAAAVTQADQRAVFRGASRGILLGVGR